MTWQVTPSNWTPERIEIATRLWIEGWSAAQIARKLGGVTRNAVIGIVHRRGLSHRALPSAPSRVAEGKAIPNREPRAARPAPPPMPPRSKVKAATPLPDSSPKPWTERKIGQCAAPVGERDGTTLSCCKPCEKRQRWAYCPEHLAAFGQIRLATADRRSLAEHREAA